MIMLRITTRMGPVAAAGTPRVARFLLVAGSCYGAWVWPAVIRALSARGHRADALDLPGHGADLTPRQGITLADYAHAIVAATPEPSILVGHSMAGYAITAAAQNLRNEPRIAGLVYLCAYRPQAGLSLAQMRRSWPSAALRSALQIADGCFSFDPDRTRDLFYHDCPPEIWAYATPRVTPEPILPQETPLAVGAAELDVAQFYIRCDLDRAIPPEFQTHMARDLPAAWQVSLDCGHSPFFAQPDALASVLDQMAQQLSHPR